jgi:hypothetical protein
MRSLGWCWASRESVFAKPRFEIPAVNWVVAHKNIKRDSKRIVRPLDHRQGQATRPIHHFGRAIRPAKYARFVCRRRLLLLECECQHVDRIGVRYRVALALIGLAKDGEHVELVPLCRVAAGTEQLLDARKDLLILLIVSDGFDAHGAISPVEQFAFRAGNA